MSDTFDWLCELGDDEIIQLAEAVLEQLGIRGINRTSTTLDPAGAAVFPEVAVHRSVLMEAEEIVNGARRGAYGHPENNFGRIANLWNAYLAGKPVCAMPITPQDVALLMVLMKVARLLETPTHRDSAVDICGYAATLEMLWDGQ